MAEWRICSSAALCLLSLWAATGLLAACQPLPHPFADDVPKPGSPMLAVRDSTSIWVAPVTGAPPVTARKLAAAVAQALQKRQVVASNRTAAIDSDVLHGRIEEMPAGPGQGETVVAQWRLSDSKGRLLGERAVRIAGKAADWRQGKDDTVTRLAAASADQLAALVDGGPPPAAAQMAMTKTGSGAIRLLIGAIKGAPGDGDTALARTIALVLQRPGLAIIAKPSDVKPSDVKPSDRPDLILDATVAVGRPKNGKEHVKIVWHLRHAGGGEIGTVAQQNDVPPGLLDGPWGNVAWSVAGAAETGILQLVAHAAPPSASGA
jgi:hypothetical protein